MKDHERLVGKPAPELRSLAPAATHQHYKGGLYRDMGIPIDSDTKEPFKDHRGILRVWEHVYPYDLQVILRPISEDEKFTDIREKT